jgi:ribosomal protein S18 acetylase RimI-like enzyme
LGDRDEAHAILRALLAAGPTPFTIHPGDWDWWVFHADPRVDEEFLIADGAIALVGNEIGVFGVDADETVAVCEKVREGRPIAIGSVSLRDTARVAQLEAHGFVCADPPEPVFVRATGGGTHGAALPDGFTIRAVRGQEDCAGRAAAARRAFKSTMDPLMHTARYRRFMASPAYDRERDIVAIAPDGRIAAFAIHWIDEDLSLAQFEPVGTDPDFQRMGLARAVLAASLERMHGLGIERARVMTTGDNVAAATAYQSAGFELVDQLGWWKREA